MRIIINGNHKDKITKALDKAQLNCRARILTCENIESILNNVSNELSIPKASMKGIRLQYTGAEKFPNAYKYQPESTHFDAEHNGRFWTITSISRKVCPNRIGNVCVILTDSAKIAILNSFSCFRA